MNKEIYANVVLKNGKLIFWLTGNKCNDVNDFNKDFYYSGLNIVDELKNYNYELKSEKINSFDEDKNFYKQFELCDGYKGKKPY